MKILIVDDSSITRIILKKALKQCLGEKAVIDEVDDGDAAIKIFDDDKNKYDFVYLDINMPKTSGLAVLKHIKEIKSEVKIIVCSVSNDHGMRRDIEKMGVYNYISKPFTAEKIKDVMNKYC